MTGSLRLDAAPLYRRRTSRKLHIAWAPTRLRRCLWSVSPCAEASAAVAMP